MVLIVSNERHATEAVTWANDAVEYEALTTVLEDDSHGPMLCLSGALMSLPPQCGDVPVNNWDWSQTPHPQSQSGSRWSDGIVVTGTFDGTTFTQTRPPRAPTDQDTARLAEPWPAPTPDFTAPCPPPAGGWLAEAANVPDGTDFNTVMQTFGAYVTSQPDFANWWPDQSINMNYSTDPINGAQASTMNDPQQLIMVAAFTGDVDRHRAELRKIWPGALCVTTSPRSNADRDTIDHALHQLFASGELGTTSLLGTTASLLGDVVLAHVTVITPELQSTLDQRFGRGSVELTGVLRPFDG
jgi:hypothetical protein